MQTRKDPAPAEQANELEQKPAKPLNPMAEAVRLGAALAKIDSREESALANAKARYDAEREELVNAASPAARRILAAAEEE